MAPEQVILFSKFEELEGKNDTKDKDGKTIVEFLKHK